MKRDDSNHEEPKEDDLNKQSSNDNVLSNFERTQRASALNATAAGLQQESENVTPDEHARDPLCGDAAECSLGVATVGCTEDDNALEGHIDGGGEESRGDEKEDGLDDVGTEGPYVAVGDDATDVADDFHYCDVVSIEV